MTAGDINQDQATLCVGEVNNNNDGSGKVAGQTVDETSATSDGGVPCTKYSLRARSTRKRVETEHRVTEPKLRAPRPKARPPPLSKYRRKTANARERDRMKDINQAFDVLERSLPEMSAQHRPSEKVTKITVLRLAINYIKAMQDLLDSEEAGVATAEEHAGPHSVGSCTSSAVLSASPSSVVTDCSMAELPDPLDTIEGLTDFQLPGGLELLLDIRSDSDALDFSCSDFSDLPSP